MKRISFILLTLSLFGCQATAPEIVPEFTSEVIEIKPDELNQYWIHSGNIKILKKRPTWLPQGKGEWTVMTVIDSNGQEVERTLISSTPEGFMTQAKIDSMPKQSFKPSLSNKNRVPVKFYGTAKIAPKDELLKNN